MNWENEKKNFYNFILNNNIIGFFKEPIKLKSGRLSIWYVNWRNISSDVFLLDQLTDYIFSFVEYIGLTPKCFFGVPEGATKLGIIIQYKWAKKKKDFGPGSYTLSMGRGKLKEHGDPKDRFFLGIPNDETIVLEDVTTTGESLIKAIKNLKQLNVKILAAIGLTNRNELRDDGRTVEEIISKEKVKYYAMSNALDLLPHLNLSQEIAEDIKEYFKKYGTEQIKLN